MKMKTLWGQAITKKSQGIILLKLLLFSISPKTDLHLDTAIAFLNNMWHTMENMQHYRRHIVSLHLPWVGVWGFC